MRAQFRKHIQMNRRDFLLKASAAAGGTAAVSGAAAAQQGNTTGNQTGGNATGGGNQTGGNATGNATGGNKTGGNQTGGNQTGGVGGQLDFGGGGTATVNVGPGGQNTFAPADVYITPGTKVKFVWKSSGHNVHPENGDWGHLDIEEAGFSYTTPPFKKMGKHHYWCDPHKSLGMVGNVFVTKTGQAPGGGGGGEEVDPEHMGVPLQAHYVGAATMLMMVVSLIYTFFLVKYGESPNAKGGN